MVEKLPIPVAETIRERRSVRTYEEKRLSTEERQKLVGYMDVVDNPFGVKVKLHITDRGMSAGGDKLGTYGVIKGADTFLGVSIPDTQLAPLAAGYQFESLILCATHMGLGTVWLAATFDRPRFASAMGIRPDELFPAVSPVGYPAPMSSMSESLMRFTMGSSARREWSRLFFEENLSSPLSRYDAWDYALPLEMLRLAPSAKNAQPWRVIMAGGVFHFYTTYRPEAPKDEAVIKHVDLGIGIAHFHQAALELGLSGNFVEIPQNDLELPGELHYVISWRPEKLK